MRLSIAIALLAFVLPASAQIYKYTDANGKTVFTNKPPTGVDAKPVDLPPAPTVQMQPPVSATPKASSNPGETTPYTILALGNLPSAEALRANNGTFSIDVIQQPRLAGNHQLRLLLDGQPYGPPSRETTFTLENIDRGEHTLAVQVLSGDRVLQSSSPVSFTVQRVHVNR
ncbi:hypothetical protein D9M71_472900 [compost metagenome]